MAEQRIGEHIVIQPGDADRNESTRSSTELVDGPGHQLLAHAGFPRQEYGLRAPGNGLRVFEQGDHLLASGIEEAENVQMFHLPG